jgi:hypothetical protein
MLLKTILENIQKENAGLDNKDGIKQLSTADKKELLQLIGRYNEYGKHLEREVHLADIGKKLARIAESARNYTLSTTEGFDVVTLKKNMDTLAKASQEFQKLANEASVLEQRMIAL